MVMDIITNLAASKHNARVHFRSLNGVTKSEAQLKRGLRIL